MKRTLSSIIKILLPLLLGFFFIWIVARKLSHQDIVEIKNAFKHANYYWILLSMVMAALSHLSRAWRWKYMLESLNIKHRFINSILTVFIAYFVNLAVPRLGDITRSGLFSRYEKVSFSKTLGTILAERVADVFMLLSLIVLALILEYDKLKGLVLDSRFVQDLSAVYTYIFLATILVLSISFIIMIRVSELKLFKKIRVFLTDIFIGLKTIVTMKKKGWFIAHTLFIWLMYFGMIYFAIFSLPETSHLSASAVLAAFVLGSISIAATNGGIGAYPLSIREILVLYGINATIGYAFGWILWAAQTCMVILFGAISLILIPLVNRDYKQDIAPPSKEDKLLENSN